MHQEGRDNLVHLLSVASLTDSPPLVEAAGRLSSTTRICAAKRADFEALLLPDSLVPSPRYADHYLVARSDNITKMM